MSKHTESAAKREPKAGFGITDGKGFCINFANGWSVSVQFGYGSYSDNYGERYLDSDEDYAARNARLGAQGSTTAECAAFNPEGNLVTLPSFMFDEGGHKDVVSNRSDPALVLRLMNWVAEQPAKSTTTGGECLTERYEALEAPLEALVNRCNQDWCLSTSSEVIEAEAALERLYKDRIAVLATAQGDQR